MAKKFIPDPELKEQILTRYKETKNYSLVSRETGLSVLIIKRIIQEEGEQPAAQPTTTYKKPTTASQVLAAKREYFYAGPAPIETELPKKTIYYGKIVELVKGYLDV